MDDPEDEPVVATAAQLSRRRRATDLFSVDFYGGAFKLQTKQKVICFWRYQEPREPLLYYAEQLMFFTSYRDEDFLRGHGEEL